MVDTNVAPDLDRLVVWQAALTRRADDLRNDIRTRQADLAQIEERLSLVTKLIDVETRAQAGTLAPGDVPARATPTDAPPAADLEQAVEEILLNAGAPLHISKIRDALREQGFPIPGRGDEANIIVRLRRSENRFTRTARGTYGLAEWGIPALVSRTRKRRKKATG